VVRRRRVDNTWPVAALTAGSEAIGSKSRFMPTLPAFNAPVWCGKTRMVWLPDGEKNFEDILICFDRMYECDRHTHGQTSQYSTVVLTVVRVMIAKYRKSGIWGYRSSLTPEPVELK